MQLSFFPSPSPSPVCGRGSSSLSTDDLINGLVRAYQSYHGAVTVGRDHLGFGRLLVIGIVVTRALIRSGLFVSRLLGVVLIVILQLLISSLVTVVLILVLVLVLVLILVLILVRGILIGKRTLRCVPGPLGQL